MKAFLSHFQVTPKNGVALLGAILSYLVLRGKMTLEEKQAYLLIATTFLALLVPARDPNANKDPDAPSAPIVAGKPEGSLTRIGGAVVDPSTSVPTPGPGVPIADDGRTVPPPSEKP